MPKESKISYTPNDKPIKEQEKDKLQVNDRIVKRILTFLEDSQKTSLAVAITGEWGIGKTSVMNLLKGNLNKDKDIVIRFEPLLEGKLEVLEIMELFYLKLYTGLKTKIVDIKDVLVKIMTSLVAIPVVGTTLKLSAPLGGVGVDFDFKQIADELFDIWETNEDQLFSSETKDLNKKITEKN